MGTQLPLPQKRGQSPQFLAHMYCGQTAAWIKIPLFMKVGLGPGHIVLDWDPAPTHQKGHNSPIFGPCLLCANGWMDQDATWYGVMARPKRPCVRWGPSSPSQKRGQSPVPIFVPCLLCPNGWMDQDATWYGGRPRPKRHCVSWGPSSPSPKKGGTSPLPNFLCCGQTAGWIKIPLGTMVGLGPGNIVVDADTAPAPRGTAPQISAHI